jgi:hypothetical protein
MAICNRCKLTIIRKDVGRAPSHCSNACRQAAYRLRSKSLRNAVIQSINTVALRNAGSHYKQTNIVDLVGLA